MAANMADISLAQRVGRLEFQNRILKMLATAPLVILAIVGLLGMARHEAQESQTPRRIVVDELVARKILADVIQLKDRQSGQETTLQAGQVLCSESKNEEGRAMALLNCGGLLVMRDEYRSFLGSNRDIAGMSLTFDLGGKSYGGSFMVPARMVVLQSGHGGSSLTISGANENSRCVLGVQEAGVEKGSAGCISLWGTDGALELSLPAK